MIFCSILRFSRRARLSGRAACLLAVLAAAVAPCGAQSILNTKHNLSSSGPGQVRAVSDDRVCVFCHTPHGARDVAPLWNRYDSTSAYIPYDSPTLKAKPGQPTGASKLCLSCHDGTVAPGDVVSESRPITMTREMSSRGGSLGTDLRDDHPISFNYFASLSRSGGELAPPGAWDPRVTLDGNSELQCTACHNPHDNQWGGFLVMPNESARLCRQCHTKQGFRSTPHNLSTKRWSGAGRDPWPRTPYPTVAANACMNCHRTHHAGGREQLLSTDVEEDVCFVCHNGNVASFDIEAVFEKPSRHPVDQSQGSHQAGESSWVNGDHVECADCHNAHRARTGESVPPFVQPQLIGVSGIDASGSPVQEATYEYEVCFKCHARDDGGNPFGSVERQINTTNRRLQFSPSSPSFHPVEVPGVSNDVPSLIPPLTEGSMVHCSDCHNNDTAASDGPGASGPHGSMNEGLLAARYVTGSGITENPRTAYALCLQCHSLTSILANEGFPKHQGHIERVKASCSVCHDSHGIDFTRGNSTNNAHLINFDMSVAKPLNGTLEYNSTGTRKGNCTTLCHGFSHNSMAY